MRFIRGIVRDSITDAPLSHASVSAGKSSRGAITDDNGLFELSVPSAARTMTVSCLGYEKKTVPVNNSSLNLYAVYLLPEVEVLQEVKVRRGRYSKKNNPAVDFVTRLRKSGRLTDPRRNPYYSYRKYQRTTIGLNEFDTVKYSALVRKFPFLVENIDTSEISGQPVLNLIVKEHLSDVYFRRNPEKQQEVSLGYRSDGVDEILDQKSMQVFLDDVLREVDLYQNDVNILQNRFVSPLSAIGPDFYRYYLTDTVKIDGDDCMTLAFYPRNKSMFGFNGHIYVSLADSSMFIRKVDMSVPADINLNFVEKLAISQKYSRGEDGSRLPQSDDMAMELRAVPGTPGVYVRRRIAYAGHSFLPLADSVYDLAGLSCGESLERDSLFWERARLTAIPESENRVGNLMSRLRSVPVYYWGEKFLKIMVSGYVGTGRNSKFDYGPVNTSVSYNTAEGVRLRAGGMTTANLSRRWFGRGYVAYGFRDHKWKYKAEAEYSFRDKEYHSREFPVQSLRLTHMYDLDQIGQHYLYTNADNMFLSLKRMRDTRVTYRRLTSLEWTNEFSNNLSIVLGIRHERQESTCWLPFVDGHGREAGHYSESSVGLQIRYAPGEKYYQTKTHRIPVNLDAPVFQLTHTLALKGVAGSRFNVNKTELSVGKRFWFSAFGYIDCIVGGGHVWSRSPYLNLLIPNVNLSYTIQPESFSLMNPMEFVNDSYVQWFFTYWANGLLFNQIPFVKKARLREVVGFRGVYGHLGRRNNPQYNADLFRFPADACTRPMDRGPYMELSAGIDNILRCLRVDYVWRLTYRSTSYPVDRSGLRVALHFTF
ncbi:MAG: DUF5686 and carboxypeptidase regulatory-like domain-containing protein [Muribaculaceae bacterium]|nr:DUF5686 and carboxypeptidase regulatory-like domain-containing protein [Muribaculaceae bacterium]